LTVAVVHRMAALVRRACVLQAVHRLRRYFYFGNQTSELITADLAERSPFSGRSLLVTGLTLDRFVNVCIALNAWTTYPVLVVVLQVGFCLYPGSVMSCSTFIRSITQQHASVAAWSMLRLVTFNHCDFSKHHTNLLAEDMCATGHGAQRLAAATQLQAATQTSRHLYASGRFCAGDSGVLPGEHALLCLQTMDDHESAAQHDMNCKHQTGLLMRRRTMCWAL